MWVSKPTGRPQPVIFARRILFIVFAIQLGGCIEAQPVPDWVLVCHDTGGGGECPPHDTGAEEMQASAPDVGPSEASVGGDVDLDAPDEG
ncbi:MAG: hypothetical protein ACPGU1_16910 [Myxococcota bacterium]